ncbi:MAG: methionine synthase [Thermocrispum sp.]
MLPVGVATGIGSMPGTDAAETAAIVLGEVPRLPYLPELPARGVGADLLGRSAALLVDIAVEFVPTGYRVTAHTGAEHRRAVDLMRWDLDAVEEAVQRAGAAPEVIKTQVAGPWTLAAGIELSRGHRVLTDRGALRDFTASLVEGVREHVAELAKRTGAAVVVQLDEPTLPAVLAGALPTASGYGTVSAVPGPDARELLASVIDPLGAATGEPVIVHCCDPRPPVSLLHRAGAGGLALDATTLGGAPGVLLDELGEAWDDGVVLLLGLVPPLEPHGGPPSSLRDLARPAFGLADRLGFNRDMLRERAIATPACGLAGASAEWMRRALNLSTDLAKAFVEPPEEW